MKPARNRLCTAQYSIWCLSTSQASVAQLDRHWSRKPEVPRSIPGRAHFSFSFFFINLNLLTAKQLWYNFYLTLVAIFINMLKHSFVVYVVPEIRGGPVELPQCTVYILRYNAVFRIRSMLSCRWSTVKWWRHSSLILSLVIWLACKDYIMGNNALLLFFEHKHNI